MMKFEKARIAGMNLGYSFFSLEYFLDSMVRVGAESIELWGGFPHLYFDDVIHPSVEKIRRAVDERGLRINCYTPEQLLYTYNIAASEPEVREMSVEFFRKNIYAAYRLGTRKVLMTSGHGYVDQPLEEAWKWSRESLRELGEFAGKFGMTIALENLQPTESNLVYTLPALQKMLAELDLPNVKAMVDVVPMHLVGETMQQYLDAFGDDLIHVHLVDGDPTGHMAWGDGKLPLDEDMKCLCENDYRHTLTFEIANSMYLYDPESAFQKSFERVKPYLK
ncbi:MAG: TIM barrel protein [Oscillospiraceae bacterium]|nr:TIM barrel protein [Oscillospiraceae bacterium]